MLYFLKYAFANIIFLKPVLRIRIRVDPYHETDLGSKKSAKSTENSKNIKLISFFGNPDPEDPVVFSHPDPGKETDPDPDRAKHRPKSSSYLFAKREDFFFCQYSNLI